MKYLFPTLPEPGLFDSVRLEPKAPLPKKSFLKGLFCTHLQRANFVRIDHRAGPGGYADCYAGSVCLGCGMVLEEVQTF